MKKTLVVFLIIFSTGAMAKEITVQVKGMICSMCAQGVQKKLKKISGVTKTVFELGKEEGDKKTLPSVVIHTEGDKDLDDALLKEIITEAGYNVASIERK